MIPRPSLQAFAAALLWPVVASARPPGAIGPVNAATATNAPPASQPGIVYRSDETDTTAKDLASQPQFSGTGLVVTAKATGTGTIIAANWVLTAKHVVTADNSVPSPAGNAVTFYYAGGNIVSDAIYQDSLSDMALVHFATTLPSNLAAITPNLNGSTKVQPVGAQIWNVGYGNWGNYGGTVNALDGARRGGTNVVDSYSSPSLIFSNNNTSGTEFECSTGPGDSGGPMFLQNGYQWRIAAIVYGADSRGFVDTDVTHENFISTTTGISFAPAAAPTALKWNTNYLKPTSNSSNTNTPLDGPGNWNTTRLNFTDGGYTYAWENGVITGQKLLPVTFGVGSGGAGTVTVTTPINISDLIFTTTGYGNYNIAGSGINGLTLAAAGSSVTVTNTATPLISAPLFGTGALTKLGAGTLALSAANTYSGGTNINVGTIQLLSPGALGTSGNIAVAAGATLDATSVNAASYTLASGRTLTDNGTFTGSLTVNGTLTGTGTVGASGTTLTVNAGGQITGAAGTLTVRGNLTNNGTISLPTGSTLDASTASFTNNATLSLTGGTATLPPSATNANGGTITIAGGTLTTTGGFTNNGTIRVTGGATLNASASGSFTNYGLLDLIEGNAKLPPNFINAGGTVLTGDLVRVKTLVRTSTAVTLTIDSYSGHKYQLQRGTSPDAASFVALGSAQAGSTGTTLTFTDSSPAADRGFYRVALVP